MSLLDKSLPIKDRLKHTIYGEICAAVYSYGCEHGLNISINDINKSESIKEWTELCVKAVMKEYESTI